MTARYRRAWQPCASTLVALAAVVAMAGPASAQAVSTTAAQSEREARARAEQAAREANNARQSAVEARERAAEAARTLAAVREAAGRAEAAADDSVRNPVLAPGCTAGDDPRTRFDRGVSGARRCALNYLRAQRREGLMAGDEDWSRVLTGAEGLSDFYRARGNRQQAIIDGGSAVTGAGALGAGLSAAAGPHTVLMWGYGALLGVMTVEFSGSQPTRDLYSAGHIGIDYIVNRYSVLYGSLQQVQQADRPAVDQACGRAGEAGSATTRLAEVEAWAGGDDKAAFLPVVRRLEDTCRRLRQGDGDLDAIVRRTLAMSDDWPTAFATDLLSLDNKLTDRDGRLRMTPGSALTAAAVGPLRLLDSLISGQNTQDAVNRLRINTLLDDMHVQLTPVRVQPPPPVIEGAVEMTPEFEFRAAASGSARPQRAAESRGAIGVPVIPSNAVIGDMATWVRTRLPLIEVARQAHNDRIFYANELNDAARRSVLQFDYAVATGAAEVQLVVPASPVPSDGPMSSAAKDDGPPVMPLPAG